MNQNMLKQSFIARAKTLANVMTRTTNVKVTVSGNQAYNIDGLINIPAGDFTDKEWLKMVEGWIDHELGHENHTDDNYFQPFAKKGELHTHLLNVIEDVWMEKAVGNRFPGARQNLATLAELAIKRGLFEDPTDTKHPLSALSAFLLYGGRAKITGQHCLDDYADIALAEVEKHFGDEFAKNLAVIRDDIDRVTDTAGAVVIAQRVIDLLKEEKDNQEQQQQGDSDDDADADSEGDQPGDSDDDADADSDGDQAGDSDDDADADSEGDQAGDSDDDADADSDGDQPGDSDDDVNGSKSGKPTPQQIIDAIEEALNEADKADIQDFHEKLAEMLGEEAEEANHDAEVNEVSSILDQSSVRADAKDFVSGPHMLDQVTAKRLSAGVYQTMHKVLFDQVQSLETTRKVGTKLVNRRLSGIPAGNLSVFSRRAETQDVSAAVSVIIDSSGSMSHDGGNSAMGPANACAFAFALGLNKSGVASEFVYYGISSQDNYMMYTAKSFLEKPVASRFGVKAGGSTPTGPAMQYALNSLLLRPEQKKMLLVITDGDPDSVTCVRNATAMANIFGVKVIPIGIKTSHVSGFEKEEFVTVQDPTELTNALRQAVRMKLFK
ncbi:MAG: hypothetical protein CML21_00515 [Rheinheimera sp.]|nr:hypothetical protein [Rheinheimera sp.]